MNLNADASFLGGVVSDGGLSPPIILLPRVKGARARKLLRPGAWGMPHQQKGLGTVVRHISAPPGRGPAPLFENG